MRLATLSFLMLSIQLGFVGFAVADSDSRRSVTVTGNCLRSIVPDRGSVTVVADVLKPDLQSASGGSMEIYNKMRTAVQKLNLKDLELTTSESTFQEEREWQKDKSVFKGFRARMGLQVATSETSRLGEVIALAAKNGIRQVSGLTTFVSQERTRTERDGCLDEAVKNARAKADIIAKAASAKVGRVLEVYEQPIDASIVVPMRKGTERMMSAQDASAAPPAIEAGSEKMTVSIVATFAFD